jgi:3-hydroxyacyl-CoA dehydrogenase / enoyl-CoA hydratase / 3-hydroxybutyryl-CoA epimerase
MASDTQKDAKSERKSRRVVTHEIVSDILVLTYDLEGESVNTLVPETNDALEAALSVLETDDALVGAVIVSGKPDGFIAGANIDMLKAVKTAGEASELSRRAQQGFDRLAASKKPIVAAIHGACLGGGFELALACQGRLASDDAKTVFALPEVQLGLLPGADGLQRVAEKAGVPTALDLGLTGKNVRPAKAKKLGLIDEVVPKTVLREAAIAFAKKLAAGADKKPASKGLDKDKITRLALEGNALGRGFVFKKAREESAKKTGGHYPAVPKIIDVLEAWASKGFAASQEVVSRGFGELVVSETAAELMGIFFATTALKKDKGTDEDVTARKVEKVAMLGAGLMGGGIAYVTTNAGIPVRLRDRDDAGLAKGVKYVADLYAARVKKGQLSRIDGQKKLSLLSGTIDYTGIGNADVIIEAVFEDIGVKHKVLAEVEAIAKPTAIFASNTSSLPITRIADAAQRPENVIGMHYFSPVQKMPLLEIITTKKTSPETIATAVALGKKQGKTVIVVNDGVGFYTSRILAPYMNEAAYLLSEGVPVEEIDRAMVDWGFPVGPMTLLDEVGIDVAAHVGPIMLAAFGERLTPPGAMTTLTDDGRKGRKNEKGVYLYGKALAKAQKAGTFQGLGIGKKPKKMVDPSLYELIGVTPQKGKLTREEIQMRCALAFVNEAMHCFGDGILRSARDGDIGAIFGLGFPPFRGGPFRYTDAVGAKEVLRRMRELEKRHGKRFTPAAALVEYGEADKKFYP